MGFHSNFSVLLVFVFGITQCFCQETEDWADDKKCTEKEKSELAKKGIQLVTCLKNNVFQKFGFFSEVQRCCKEAAKDGDIESPSPRLRKFGKCMRDTFSESASSCSAENWNPVHFFQCNNEGLREKMKEMKKNFACFKDVVEKFLEKKADCEAFATDARTCLRSICSEITEKMGNMKISQEHKLSDIIEPICEFLSKE